MSGQTGPWQEMIKMIKVQYGDELHTLKQSSLKSPVLEYRVDGTYVGIVCMSDIQRMLEEKY